MKEPPVQIYEFDGFCVDASKRSLTNRDGQSIPLTPKVFDTLLYLVRSNGKVIGKDELMREIWMDSIVEENNLTQNISILRRIFGEKPGEHRFIVTIAGHGYRFVPEVRILDDEASGSHTVNDNAATVKSSDRLPAPTRSSVNRSRILQYVFVGILVLGLITSVFYVRKGPKSVVSDSGITTVAVLPFKPLVAEDRNEAMEMGMADSLISKLGSGKIIVRPLSSVTRYVALDQDSLKAGRELDAEIVLDGTIQTSGDRIRVSARLVRVSDGKQLWAGQFDEEFTDIFTVQDSISEKVAAALKIPLGDDEKKHFTQNIEAYQLYMKGRFHLLKAIKSETITGVSYFQQAIEADPDYALAYVGLADAYRGLVVGGEMPSAEFMPKAKAAAKKAIEIDDSLAEAHANLGHIMFWYDWDWKAAESEYKRALELNPNSPDALQFYAHLLSSSGRHTEALDKIRLARELDPVNLRVNALEGMMFLYAGQTDEAVSRLQKTLELDPNYRLTNVFLARAYIEKGMYVDALAAFSKVREISPATSESIAYSAYALAKLGKIAEARNTLEQLIVSSKTRWVSSYNIALIYNALGDPEKALDHLERAFAEKDVRMVFLKVEPQWRSLRAVPRFQSILLRMNL